MTGPVFIAAPIVEVHVKPYKDMRYPTAGDWQWRGNTLVITVAQMPDPRYEQLLAFHELSEAWMCKHDGVSEKDVDKWDMAHPDADEPGDLPGAPYGPQHKAATESERWFADKLGVNWSEYEKAIEALGK